jgi:hypothetical protein
MPDATDATDATDAMDARDAWTTYCARLAALGDRLRGAEFPQDALARAEGVRYLARMAALGLQQGTDFDDPSFPVLYRLNDDITKWAGPNVDNIYLGAAVRAPHVYRLSGTVARSGGFILQTLTGWWGEPGFRIHDDRSSAVFTPDPDGRISIVIGGPEQADNWMPLHPAADHLFVREYAIDWAAHDRCEFVLERIDAEPVSRPVLDEPRVVQMLDVAAHWVEHTVVYWHGFEAQMMRPLAPNTFGEVFTTPGGGADIFYGNGRIELDPEHVLLVEVDEPDARYWSLQLYNEAWYESLDFESRCTNRNNTQVHVDPDGVARFVVSERDPGTPNWLDLAGHTRAFAHFRAVWCRRATTPRATVVAVDDLRDRLPATHPSVTPAERAAELGERRAQVARRHRR